MAKVTAPWTNEKVEILDRERIESIIEGLNSTDVVRAAWAGYIPEMKIGYAAVNLITGELETESLAQNEMNQGTDALWISVYAIGPNPLEWPDEDIYEPEEIEAFEQSDANENGLSIDEFIELDEGELEERHRQALVHYYDEDREAEKITEQLDQWYK